MSLLVSPRRLGRTVHNGLDRGSYNGVRAALGDGVPPGAIFKAMLPDLQDSIGLSSGPVQPGRAYTGPCTVAVTGLLTTDTILADSTDQPTCSVNGTLTIAAGAVVYGVSISRDDVQIGYYPCAEGAGTRCLNKLSGGSALPHGTISASTVHTSIYSGAGFDLNVLGYSNRQNLIKYSEDDTQWALLNNSGQATKDGKNYHLVTTGDQCRSNHYSTTIGEKYQISAEVTPLAERDTVCRLQLNDTDGAGIKYAELAIKGGRRIHFVATSTKTASPAYFPVTPVGGGTNPNPATNIKIDKFHVTKYVSNYPPIGKIVCLGDSLTARAGFTEYLAVVLDQTTIINAGVSGNTLPQMDARFAADVVAQSPDYVVILGSVNDRITGVSVADSQTAMLSMLSKASAAGIKVVLGEPLPAGAESTWNASKQAAHEEYIAWQNLQSCHKHIPLYNIFTELGTANMQVGLTNDGLHPFEWGLRLIGAEVAEALGATYSEYTPTTATMVEGCQPAFSASLDAIGSSLQYPGPIKLSLQGSAGAYYWPSSPRILLRTGVDNAVYDAAGAGIEFATPALALAAMATVADDTYLFVGAKGAVLYETDQSANLAKIQRAGY